MTPLLKKFFGINWIIVINIAVLIVFGVFAISIAAETRTGFGGKWSQQVIWSCIGGVVMIVTALIDYKWVRWGSWIMYGASILGLIAVKIIGVTMSSGARSWLAVGPITVQPSQFAIVAGIAVLAIVFGDLQRVAPIFRYPFLRIALGGVMSVVPMLMILKEPDLGSAMVWGPTFVGMILVGSIPFRYLIVLLLAVLTFLPIAFFFGLKDYQRDRITTYLDMLTNKPVNIQEAAWVPYHLQLAVGSAGFQGKHQLAKSGTISSAKRTIHETFFPNEAINDFISGVICEEFGFRGMVLLITGMSLLIFQCIFVAFYSRDQMGRLLVVGIVAALTTYIFMNIGMNMLLVPITGLPLPFISYGGTFMVVVLFMIGLVQSVWVHRNISPARHSRSREDDEE